MDAQLKKGFIEYCVLAAIKNADSYGYQIVKDVSHCIETSESTLYPILKRLEVSRFVSTYSVEHNSRLRKYYHITQLGVQQLERFIGEWNEIEKIYDFVRGDSKDE